jgi:hypothetical protein
MKKGYQIIEPPSLSGLFPRTASFDVTVALLSWLVETLRVELNDRLGGAEIELIRAEYQGAYPAIGIHYPAEEGEDLGLVVETAITELLRQRSMADFVSFLARARTDWRKVTDDLVGARE